VLESCALCKKKRPLRMSHVIPSFVGKWLKETSGTGLLRSIVNPDERVQDLRTLPLLCDECEERLSAFETYFAKNVFYPFFEGKTGYRYDFRLKKFMISLSWRTLLVSYADFKNDLPKLCGYVDKAEEAWRKYLLGSLDAGPYEHHLFFLNFVQNGEDLPRGFEWYSLRGIDATLVGNEQRAMVYSKLPWIILVSSIYPTKLEGWEHTRIDDAGEIQLPQSIKDGGFGDFLLNRVGLVFGKLAPEMADKRILKTIKKKPKMFLTSQSVEVSLAEAKRRRDLKKRNLSRTLNEFIWIVEGALEDTHQPKEVQQLHRLGRSVLADALLDTSEHELLKLEKLIGLTIRESSRSHRDCKNTLDTDQLVIVFMVTPCFSKVSQRLKVAIEFRRMMRQRKKSEKRHLIVTSFNPYDKNMPFENAFYVA